MKISLFNDCNEVKSVVLVLSVDKNIIFNDISGLRGPSWGEWVFFSGSHGLKYSKEQLRVG